MKIKLTIITLLFSLYSHAQVIDPAPLTNSVGTLNQVSNDSAVDPRGSMNQQDQAERQYQEEKQREKDEWEASKPEVDKEKNEDE